MTIPNSDNEQEIKMTIRRSPQFTQIPTWILDSDNSVPELISDSDDSDPKPKKPLTKKTVNTTLLDQSDSDHKPKKSPAETIVNNALKKLGIKTPPTTPPAKPTRSRSHRTNHHRHPHTKHQPNYTPQSLTHIKEFLNGPKELTIALEGNIGIGKSTLLNQLEALGPITIKTIREPLSQWTNNAGINLLEKSYSNPKKWSFILQSLIMTNLLQNHMAPGRVKLMERTLGAAYNVFLQIHHANETMDHEAITTLQEWYHTATNLYATDPDIIIYLRGSPELAMKQMKLRNRKE